LLLAEQSLGIDFHNVTSKQRSFRFLHS